MSGFPELTFTELEETLRNPLGNDVLRQMVTVVCRMRVRVRAGELLWLLLRVASLGINWSLGEARVDSGRLVGRGRTHWVVGGRCAGACCAVDRS